MTKKDEGQVMYHIDLAADAMAKGDHKASLNHIVLALAVLNGRMLFINDKVDKLERRKP